MDNVHVTKKYATAAMAAVLVFGAVAAGLIGAPQTAYAAVTIEASADSFFGPGFVRVLITDTAFDESGDTINPTVEARDGSTVLGTDNPTIESIGGSGTFEFFITTSDFPLQPANPTKTSNVDASFDDGPFIIRANTVSADTLDEGAGTDVNGAATLGGVGYALAADPADIDNFRIVYGGQTLTIDFSDSTAEITADRTEAGDGTEIILSMNDQDANSDPTLIDEFENGGLDTGLASTNTLTLGDGTWRETGQNTGIFELFEPITVDGSASSAATNQVDATLPTGNSFTFTDHETYEDLSADGAQAPFDEATETDDTDSVSITLRNRDGAVALEDDATIAGGLKPQITDADKNIDTTDEDDITNTGGAALAADTDLDDSLADATILGTIIGVDFDGDGTIDPSAGEAEFFSFTETDDSTGIFVPDYSDDMITIEIAAAGDLDGAGGVITLTPAMIEDELDINLIYKDSAFQTDSTFELISNVVTTIGDLSAETTEVGITDDAVITLTAPDLNQDSDTIETYDASGGEFEIGGEVVATLKIEAGTVTNVDLDGDDNIYGNGDDEDDILRIGGVDATFIETGPDTGVFVADDIDIGDIDDNADGDNNGDTNLDDGEQIDFIFDDFFDDTDDEDSEVTLTLGIPDAGIDVDRSTVPVPEDGDPVTIVLSVIDPTANTNPGSTETIEVPLADMVARDGDGDSFDGPDADFFDLTGIDDDIVLTETGPNTGIFEEDVDLEPDGLTFAANGDRLIDTRVTFEYDDETVSVTYRAFDGTITVSPAVVSTGGIFTVTVTDSDENKDPDEEETVDVDFETDEDTDTGSLTLTETGPNTGIFTEEVEVGVDIDVVEGDDFTAEITLTYVDAITSAGDDAEDKETTVRVATSTGQLIVIPEVVGPGTEITLQLIDSDLNDNPNGVDDTAADIVELSSSDGDDADIAFEETGPNTGIFEATIQFEPRDPDDDGTATAGAGTDDVTYSVLPGDVLAFRYEDEETSGGGSTVVSATFEITSVDPTMEAASPTVQIGATIALTIEDSDANRDADSLDSVDVDITSDTDPVGFTLSALETGENTGIFTVNVPTSETVVSGSITVESGDDVFLEYEDEFPADYADRVETTLDPSKDFVLVVPVGTSVSTDTSATTPEPVVPKDISGNELDEVSAGQQVVLSTTVNNNRNTDLDYAAIIEVRDADGFTVSLQWATGTLPAGGENNVGLSWTPMEAGTYTVRTFVLSSVENPSALSLIEESTLTVS